jgi:hypothetical protein
MQKIREAATAEWYIFNVQRVLKFPSKHESSKIAHFAGQADRASAF